VERKRLATTIPETIPLMAKVGAKVVADVGMIQVPPEASAQQVAFLLFHEILGPHVPPLHGEEVQRVAEWLEARQQELARMKHRCQAEAARLVACATNLREGRSLFRDAVVAMESEISELLRADRRQAKALVRTLTESDSAWVAVAAALGSALDSNPLAAASWGMGALAVLGAGALRVARERKAEIASSPWSFIYYVRQR
jgi:hypothetical protein